MCTRPGRVAPAPRVRTAEALPCPAACPSLHTLLTHPLEPSLVLPLCAHKLGVRAAPPLRIWRAPAASESCSSGWRLWPRSRLPARAFACAQASAAPVPLRRASAARPPERARLMAACPSRLERVAVSPLAAWCPACALQSLNQAAPGSCGRQARCRSQHTSTRLPHVSRPHAQVLLVAASNAGTYACSPKDGLRDAALQLLPALPSVLLLAGLLLLPRSSYLSVRRLLLPLLRLAHHVQTSNWAATVRPQGALPAALCMRARRGGAAVACLPCLPASHRFIVWHDVRCAMPPSLPVRRRPRHPRC